MNPVRLVVLTLACLGLTRVPVSADDIQSRYAVISYENAALLEAFNNRLFMGRLRYLMRGKASLTVEDEVKNKMDVITLSVQDILDMYPTDPAYSVSLCRDREDVRDKLDRRSDDGRGRAGVFASRQDRVYLSVPDTTLRVVAHEVGHVVVEKYFKTRPPEKIHELLAQFVEKHIDD
ncbi:hypothetical protein [Desulfatiferula olefinivorans]